VHLVRESGVLLAGRAQLGIPVNAVLDSGKREVGLGAAEDHEQGISVISDAAFGRRGGDILTSGAVEPFQ
jgi:hypothetical protein